VIIGEYEAEPFSPSSSRKKKKILQKKADKIRGRYFLKKGRVLLMELRFLLLCSATR